MKPLSHKKAGRCKATGKLKYRSAFDAGIALGNAQRRRRMLGQLEHVEQRHYLCEHCGGHHLTSKTKAPHPS